MRVNTFSYAERALRERQVLLPEAHSFYDIFEKVQPRKPMETMPREWYYPRYNPSYTAEPIISPNLTLKRDKSKLGYEELNYVYGSVKVRPAIGALIVPDLVVPDHLTWDIIDHGETALVILSYGKIIGSRWIADIQSGSIPAFNAELAKATYTCNVHHHIGTYCARCGNDERNIGRHLPDNPDWNGYTVEEFVKRWAISSVKEENADDPTRMFVTLIRNHPIGDTHGVYRTAVELQDPDTLISNPRELAMEIIERYLLDPGADMTEFKEFLGDVAYSEFEADVKGLAHKRPPLDTRKRVWLEQAAKTLRVV